MPIKQFGIKNTNPIFYTVAPESRHWSCQSGESNLRAQFSGDVQVGIRLRPVDSMHLARYKGILRCAVKLLCKEFIKIVPNIIFFSPLKISILALLDVPDVVFEDILDSSLSAATLTNVEFKTFK